MIQRVSLNLLIDLDTVHSDFFATDISEVEDFIDSEGVIGVPNRAASSIVGSENLTAHDDGNFTTEGLPVGSQIGTSYAGPKLPEQLSANGRAVLRKFFAKAEPVTIPMGHPTVAFTEPQLHAILRTIFSETVQSSVHVMKALLMHAAQGGIKKLSHFRKTVQRTTSASQRVSDSSDGGTDTEGYSTDGYTSGALPSDEEIATYDMSPNTHFASTSGVMDPQGREDPTETTLSPTQFGIPSPGFSEGGYAPLSTIRASPTATPTGRSPPRKRRRMDSNPGKIMMPAYFKGIQWTRIFVTGPLDPVHNKYKFYCQICKSNVSIFSKGAREIIRHHQSEAHLRKDQRCRYEHLGKKDKITGVIKHEVRVRDGHILTAMELEKEKLLFESAVLVDIGPKYPFYGEYLQRMGCNTTPADVRLGTQIYLLGLLTRHCGNISVLQSL